MRIIYILNLVLELAIESELELFMLLQLSLISNLFSIVEANFIMKQPILIKALCFQY
jgi:hypothetical protein